MNNLIDKNKNKINIKKSDFNAFNLFKTLIFSFFVFFFIKINKKKKIQKNITLLDTYIDTKFYPKDYVYPKLNEFFKKKGIKNVYFVPNFEIHKNIFSLYKNIKLLSKKNYLFKESRISIKDFFVCIFNTLFFSSKNYNKLSFTKFNSLECKSLILEELNSKKEFYSELQAKLKTIFLEKFLKGKINIVKSIGRFENQSVDKAWFYSFRKFSPKTDLYGYQGFLYYPHLMNQSPTSYEDKANLIPKKIIITGKIIKNKRNEFYKNINFIIGPSLLKQNLFKKIKKKYDYKFSLALCGIKSIDEKLISWLVFSLKKNRNLFATIKTHPILPLNKIKSFEINQIKNQIYITSESVDRLLEKTEILISSGPTSIVFESLIYGCKLFYLFLDPSDKLMFNKLPIPKKNYHLINNKEKLLELMTLFSKRKHIKKKNDLNKLFYTKVNDKNIRVFY